MTSLRAPAVLREILSPTTAHQHHHDEECPMLYLQPSMPDFWSLEQEDRENLQSAGLMSLMRYDFAEIPDEFTEKIKLEFFVGNEDDSIFVSPSVLAQTGPGNIAIPAPVVAYGVADLQRLFPDLPARSSHSETLEVAPEHTDENWLRPATRRYFAVPIIEKSPGGTEYILFETCFHMPFFDFLTRLQYVFGWPGYPHKFPIQYFPMAVVSFETGGHLPWADLLFQELVKDLMKFQNRIRICPRLVRIWKMIYDEVVLGRVPEMERNPRLFEMEPQIFNCARRGIPFNIYHYHAEQISRFTPALLHECLNSGCCLGPPSCPLEVADSSSSSAHSDDETDCLLKSDFESISPGNPPSQSPSDPDVVRSPPISPGPGIPHDSLRDREISPVQVPFHSDSSSPPISPGFPPLPRSLNPETLPSPKVTVK